MGSDRQSCDVNSFRAAAEELGRSLGEPRKKHSRAPFKEHRVDKLAWGYDRWYGEVLAPVRHAPLKFLEIGVRDRTSIKIWDSALCSRGDHRLMRPSLMYSCSEPGWVAL